MGIVCCQIMVCSALRCGKICRRVFEMIMITENRLVRDSIEGMKILVFRICLEFLRFVSVLPRIESRCMLVPLHSCSVAVSLLTDKNFLLW